MPKLYFYREYMIRGRSLHPNLGQVRRKKRRKQRRSSCMTQAYKSRQNDKVQTLKNWYSTTSSRRDTKSFFSGNQSLLADLPRNHNAGGVPLQPHILVTEPALSILQMVKRHYTRTVDYKTCQLENHLTRYDDALLSFITKRVKKIKSLMKTQFYNPSDLIQIISFFATFKLVRDKNCIQERAAM